MNIRSSFVYAPSLLDEEPPELQRLFPREREIASLVYARGCATAKEVEVALSKPLGNAALRSMLNRLVAKGILTRQKVRARRAFVYGPALTEAAAKERSLKQLAEDFFDGSIADVAAAIADLFAAEMIDTSKRVHERHGADRPLHPRFDQQPVAAFLAY